MQYQLFSLLVALAALPFVGSSTGDEHKRAGPDMLTKMQIRQIRSIVYDQGACTRINFDAIFPQREVDLPPALVALHRERRFSTLKLLLDITIGGRPSDAQAAGVLALALEEGPATVVMLLDNDIKNFDSPSFNNGPSDRDDLVQRLNSILAKQH